MNILLIFTLSLSFLFAGNAAAQAFQCKIKGKDVIYTDNYDSDDPYIGVRLANIYPKELMPGYGTPGYDYRTTFKEPLFVTEEVLSRATITTVYFKIKNYTYGISMCQGMWCVTGQNYSFTTFDGNKRVSQAYCDEGSESDFKFPFKRNEKEKLISLMKDVLIVKKSPLKFSE